jgi:hypothetical protein
LPLQGRCAEAIAGRLEKLYLKILALEFSAVTASATLAKAGATFISAA